MSIISLIVAAGERNNVIGRNNGLPWSVKKLPPDMRYFVEKTAGHPVIMGRRTQDSILEKYWPLDQGRTTIVLSHSLLQGGIRQGPPVTHVTHDFDEALWIAERSPGHEEIFVAGGEQVYRLALPYADRIYKTLVDEDPEGDTFFPPHPDIMREIARQVVPDFIPRLTMVTYEH